MQEQEQFQHEHQHQHQHQLQALNTISSENQLRLSFILQSETTSQAFPGLILFTEFKHSAEAEITIWNEQLSDLLYVIKIEGTTRIEKMRVDVVIEGNRKSEIGILFVMFQDGKEVKLLRKILSGKQNMSNLDPRLSFENPWQTSQLSIIGLVAVDQRVQLLKISQICTMKSVGYYWILQSENSRTFMVFYPSLSKSNPKLSLTEIDSQKRNSLFQTIFKTFLPSKPTLNFCDVNVSQSVQSDILVSIVYDFTISFQFYSTTSLFNELNPPFTKPISNWNLDLSPILPAEAKYIIHTIFFNEIRSHNNFQTIVFLILTSEGEVTIHKIDFNIQNKTFGVSSMRNLLQGDDLIYKKDDFQVLSNKKNEMYMLWRRQRIINSNTGEYIKVVDSGIEESNLKLIIEQKYLIFNLDHFAYIEEPKEMFTNEKMKLATVYGRYAAIVSETSVVYFRNKIKEEKKAKDLNESSVRRQELKNMYSEGANNYSLQKLPQLINRRNFSKIFTILQQQRNDLDTELIQSVASNPNRISADFPYKFEKLLNLTFLSRIFVITPSLPSQQYSEKEELDANLIQQLFKDEAKIVNKFNKEQKYEKYLRDLFIDVETESVVSLLHLLIDEGKYRGLFMVYTKYLGELVKKFKASIPVGEAADQYLSVIAKPISTTYLPIQQKMMIKIMSGNSINYQQIKPEKKEAIFIKKPTNQTKQNQFVIGNWQKMQLLEKYLELRSLINSLNETSQQICQYYIRNPDYKEFIKEVTKNYCLIPVFKILWEMKRFVDRAYFLEFIENVEKQMDENDVENMLRDIIEEEIDNVKRNGEDSKKSLRIIVWIPERYYRTVYSILLKSAPRFAMLFSIKIGRRAELAQQFALNQQALESFTSPPAVTQILLPLTGILASNENYHQLYVNQEIAKVEQKLNMKQFISARKLAEKAREGTSLQNEIPKGVWQNFTSKLNSILSPEALTEIERGLGRVKN